MKKDSELITHLRSSRNGSSQIDRLKKRKKLKTMRMKTTQKFLTPPIQIWKILKFTPKWKDHKIHITQMIMRKSKGKRFKGGRIWEPCAPICSETSIKLFLTKTKMTKPMTQNHKKPPVKSPKTLSKKFPKRTNGKLTKWTQPLTWPAWSSTGPKRALPLRKMTLNTVKNTINRENYVWDVSRVLWHIRAKYVGMMRICRNTILRVSKLKKQNTTTSGWKKTLKANQLYRNPSSRCI